MTERRIYDTRAYPAARPVLTGIALDAALEGAPTPHDEIAAAIRPAPPVLDLPDPGARFLARFNDRLHASDDTGEARLCITCPECGHERGLMLFTDPSATPRTATLACPAGHTWSCHYAQLMVHVLTAQS